MKTKTKLLSHVESLRYGEAPVVVDSIPIDVNEMMAYLYLPINIPKVGYAFPRRFGVFYNLLDKAFNDYKELKGYNDLVELFDDTYIYITAKHLFVTADNPGNRPGYHCDGFLSNDTNYIWYDTCPTVFCIQPYENVVEDHLESLEVFDLQSHKENEVTFPTQTLLRLSPYVVHRTPDIKQPHMRTFVKLSFSKERYNLKGNSINYDLNYNWKMYERTVVRNHPVYNEVDFYNPSY